MGIYPLPTLPAPHHQARRLRVCCGRRPAGPAASVLGGSTEAQRTHLGGRPARRRGPRRGGAGHRRTHPGDGRAPRHALLDRRRGAGVRAAARGGGRRVGPAGPRVEEVGGAGREHRVRGLEAPRAHRFLVLWRTVEERLLCLAPDGLHHYAGGQGQYGPRMCPGPHVRAPKQWNSYGVWMEWHLR